MDMLERAKAAEERVKNLIKENNRLRAVLDSVGAEQRLDGWFWPFYVPDGPPVMMPTKTWIRLRQSVGLAEEQIKPEIAAIRASMLAINGQLSGMQERLDELLSMVAEGKYDNTSSEVLPDIGGQNLTD